MISPFTTFISKILVFCILLGSVITGGYDDANIKVVGDNITKTLLSSKYSASVLQDAKKLTALIEYDEKGNAYFNDIDYEDISRASWKPSAHLERAEKLAVLYRNETDEAKKQEYKEYVLKLIDYWTAHDYQSDNWWYNRLSVPNTLGEIGLLMKDDMSRRQLRALASYAGRGCYTVSPVLYDHTGANAIDLAMSSIKFGALTGSRYAIKKAVKEVVDELDYSDGEGLKNDSTFFQHGNRIYMGGYGIEFITGITEVIAMLSGTEYIFTEAQLKPFAGFILDGLRMMSFGSTLDPTTMGRSVSRKNPQPLNGIVSTLRKLAAVEEMPRKDEILAYADSIANNKKSDYGVKYFETAKFLVVNSSDFYFSFRGGADDLAYSEIINDENVLGYNSSYPGVTTIMHTGKEYTNISPIYDYSFVPGTTAVYETDGQLFAHEDFTYRYLKGTYGSAAADGAAAVLAKTSHEGIDMTVSCFATDNAAVLLGAGMKDSQGRKMNTTLDQSFYTGSFERDGNTVIHNGIKYTVLDGGKLNASAAHRTGDWHRNNLPMASEAADGDIFTIYLENNGTYAYSVMSENTDAEFEVIMNAEKIQAVRLPDGRVAASFIEKGEFTYGGKTYSGNAGDVKIF